MNRSRVFLATLTISLTLTLPACVRKSTHQVVLADLARTRTEYSELEERMRVTLEERERRESELTEELRRRERDVARLEADVTRLETEVSRLERDLAKANGELGRLHVLVTRQGDEYRMLRERLDALAQVEQEIRERNRIYEDMVRRFQSLIDGGQLSVKIVRGRMVIELPQDILFRSGSAALSQDGVRTLREVGQVLAGLEDRRFQVEGHTDNVPIATDRFPSNWELSAARAISVIRVLLDAGVPPDRLSGAAYGEYQPVASNDTPEGRQLNRRIEIVMLPNLDVIASAAGQE